MAARGFVSGPWTGYWTYRHFPGECRTDLQLEFSNGRMTGSGADEVGPFVIGGGYDESDGRCSWTKSYVGAHDVRYSGVCANRVISGEWQVRRGWTGGFRIWPVDAGAVSEAAEETSEAGLELVTSAPSHSTI
jgi:hypothetical protein